MNLTQKEKKRAENLLAQGVSAKTVSNLLKKDRTFYQENTAGQKASATDFGIGLAKGAGQILKSTSDLGEKLLKPVTAGADYLARYGRSAYMDIPVKQAVSEISDISQKREKQSQEFSSAIDEKLEAEGASQEAGVVTSEMLAWLAPQTKITKLSSGLNLARRAGAQALGGAGTGFVIGGEGDRLETALYGGIGGAGGEFVAPVLGSVLKHVKKVPELNFQDIFKRKKTTGKTTDTPTVKEYGALEEALESKKTGLTTENRGFVSKFLDSETDIMQPYQKKALTVADPKDFKEAMDTIIMRNKDLDNPSLHEFAIKKVEKTIDKYSDVNKKAGKIIGDSRLKMDRSTYNKWGDLKDTKIRPIVDDFLSKNGYKYENGDIIKSSKKSTAFSPEDKTLLKESLEIIYDNDKSITGGDLRRLVDDLNSDFNKKGSQSLAKSIGKDIRDFRNSKLNKKELEAYKKYSETIDFINEFKNSKNPAQKISTFLNTSGTSRDFKIKDIASELKKHTGTDINEIANLTRVLVERLPKGDSNLTSFAQLMGNANIPMSAFGIAETGAQMSKGLLKKMFGADIMSEMNKAGLTKYKK